MSENIEHLLNFAIENGASDVHIKTNRESILRIKKKLTKTNITIDEKELNDFINVYVENLQKKVEFKQNRRNSLDAALSFNGRRFRLHMYRSNNGLNATLRLLSEDIPELVKLNLPPDIKRLTKAEKGLVLVCGATGSGKTTTIASIINEINKTRAKIIITIEDPIEYIYKEEMSVIEQREVGVDTESFTQAGIDAMREDTDVLVVGELRDLDTIKNAITLAETGHLVFGTLHSKSVIDTIDRLIDVFPPEQQQQIRNQLSSVLFSIIHQQMVGTEKGVVVIAEMLMMNSVLANQLKSTETKPNAIKDYMRTKKDIGCQHITDNILWHIENRRLELTDVKFILDSDDYRLLEMRLNY